MADIIESAEENTEVDGSNDGLTEVIEEVADTPFKDIVTCSDISPEEELDATSRLGLTDSDDVIEAA